MLKDLLETFKLVRQRSKLEVQIKDMEATRERVAQLLAETIKEWYAQNLEVFVNAARFEFLRDDPPLSLAVRKKNPTPGDGRADYIYLDGPQLEREVDAARKEKAKFDGLEDNDGDHDVGMTKLVDTKCCGKPIVRTTRDMSGTLYVLWKCQVCGAGWDCYPQSEEYTQHPESI